MPAGVTLKQKRKAGAFTGGELAAGEIGVDTTNSRLQFSADGTTIVTPVSDTAYNESSWNGVTNLAPSQNAVRDQFEAEPSASRTLSNKSLSGDLTMLESSSLALDPALSADGTYTGITRTGTAGATLAFGDLCYLDPTDSRWELTDANAAAGADGDARGVIGFCVQAAASDGSATKILLWGTIRADAAFPSMTVNNPMYVSETPGDITGTRPTTTDVVIRVIGTALTADELFLNPSPDYITPI